MEAVWSGQARLAQGRSPYARHRPEETLLYQVIDDNYPDFVAQPRVSARVRLAASSLAPEPNGSRSRTLRYPVTESGVWIAVSRLETYDWVVTSPGLRAPM
jgi:hypothetical protein